VLHSKTLSQKTGKKLPSGLLQKSLPTPEIKP
jgi:hypothetical protein